MCTTQTATATTGLATTSSTATTTGTTASSTRVEVAVTTLVSQQEDVCLVSLRQHGAIQSRTEAQSIL